MCLELLRLMVVDDMVDGGAVSGVNSKGCRNLKSKAKGAVEPKLTIKSGCSAMEGVLGTQRRGRTYSL